MNRFALTSLLIALLTVWFTSVANGQSTASQPHVFWGDLPSGDPVVRALDETGAVIVEQDRFWFQRWSLPVFPHQASKVAFELESRLGPGRVKWFDVQAGAITEIRVFEFFQGEVSPSPFLDSEQPGTHQFHGSGLDSNILRALRRPAVMSSDGLGLLIQSVYVVNGSWSVVIERAGDLVRTAVFETRIGPRLYRTEPMAVYGGGRSILTREDFRPVTEAAVFWGQDVESRLITLLSDERGAVDKMTPVDGLWSLVSAEPLWYEVNFFVLKSNNGSSWRWTGPREHLRGVVTEVTPADFDRTEWPGMNNDSDSLQGATSSRPSEVDVVILARLRSNQRIEFRVRLTESGHEILPPRRFLPSRPPVGRWLRSSPISFEVSGWSVVIGSVIARRTASGSAEFGFRPDWERISDQFPAERFLPTDVAIDRWFQSGVITVPIAP